MNSAADVTGIQVGGLGENEGNFIAGFSGPTFGNGVDIAWGRGSTISGNRIFQNRQGIELRGDSGWSDGHDVNDAYDDDTGPNDKQNYPELSFAGPPSPGLSVSEIAGRLPRKLGDTEMYHLEFFANKYPCDSAGFGQGEYFLGASDVAIDSSGEFSVVLPTVPPLGLTQITATATDASGNTSEFSRCQQYFIWPAPPPNFPDPIFSSVFDR